MTENLKLNGFTELSHNEMYAIDGGGPIGDIIKETAEAIVEAAKFVYEVGKDLGQEFYHYVWKPIFG